MKYKAVLFDLIGTTVKEEVPDTIGSCFEQAFAEHGLILDKPLLNLHRGLSKPDMIRAAFQAQGMSINLLEPVYASFRKNFQERISSFSEFSGAQETFAWLKSYGIQVGIGTALDTDLLEMIMQQLDWKREAFDFIGVTAPGERPRPYPDMIWRMVKQFNLSSAATVLKVGDTIADIQEGKNAGAVTAAFVSGTQPIELLLAENPDFVVRALPEIKRIVTRNPMQTVGVFRGAIGLG